MADETATLDAPAATTTEATPTAPDTSWQQAIPADYAKDKAFEPLKSKGLGDVLKSYAEAQKLVSSSIRLPGKDAKPEEVARVKAKLAEAGLMRAAPATPADYKLKRPEAAEQLGWDEAAETHMRGVWYKAGLDDEQMQAVVDGYAEWQMKRLGMAEEFVTKTEDELKTEWGAEYDATLGRATRFVKATGEKYGIPELLRGTGLGNHANVIRWVADLSKTTGEHTVIENGPNGTTNTDFERKHQELLVEMGKVNPGSPRAKELEASLESLLKTKYPG